MKKSVIALALAFVTLFLFAGCESTPYNYDLDEYLQFNTDYNNFEIDRTSIDTAVESALQSIASNNTTVQEITEDRAVIDGDTVNIDYKGKRLDTGEYFSGGTATGTDLVIGSNSFITGFESGIIGAYKGDTLAIPLTFPEDYSINPDLAGVEVEFTVTVNSISASVASELTDEAIAEHTKNEYTTIEDYKKSVFDKNLYSALWTQIAEKVDFKKKPDKEIEKIYNSTISNTTSYAIQYGMTLTEFVSTYYSSDIDAFCNQMVASATNQVKEEMIVYYIFRKENLECTDELYNSIGETVAKDNYDMTLADLEKSLSDTSTIKTLVIQRIVADYIIDKATIPAETTAAPETTAA